MPPVSARYDAVVIGAGHNGLTAALYLARAGWKVCVVERQPMVGGAVQSAEVTLPGFVHDLWSTNQNLFLGSAVYRDFRDDLERHGLRYRVSERPFCNVFPDGTALRTYRDLDRTVAELARHHPGDAEGWRRLRAHFEALVKSLVGVMAAPAAATAAANVGARALAGVGPVELRELVRILVSSTRELGDEFFATREAKALLATWGLHIDFGPDVAGGALVPLLETFGGVDNGMAIAEGGAQHMPDALAALVREHGGEVRTNAEAVGVAWDRDGRKGDGRPRAVGVALADGTVLGADRAVVANLTPTVLFERLMPDAPLGGDAAAAVSGDFRHRVGRYQYGPGTVMVHLALREPLAWAAGDDLREFAYVHVAPYVEDLAETYTDCLNGVLPASPALIVGQTTAVDPSRAPDGRHVLWVQVRGVPNARGPLRGDRLAGTPRAIAHGDAWDDALAEAFAERVLDKLEAYAPGVRDRTLGRRVYGPLELERINPNLYGGDSVAGSHHLRQNFMFRPVPGWATYETPVAGLYMIGAATWPGAGTNAASGYLCAQQLLHPHATRDAVLKGAAALGAAGAGAALLAQWWRRGRDE